MRSNIYTTLGLGTFFFFLIKITFWLKIKQLVQKIRPVQDLVVKFVVATWTNSTKILLDTLLLTCIYLRPLNIEPFSKIWQIFPFFKYEDLSFNFLVNVNSWIQNTKQKTDWKELFITETSLFCLLRYMFCLLQSFKYMITVMQLYTIKNTTRKMMMLECWKASFF